MRIIAGKYRGKKLWSPEGKDVRPTSERAREAVFNILYSHLNENYENLELADIFAGTGAFGFEAISRGFKYVCFVDKDTNAVQKNAKLFPNETEKFNILRADALNLPRAKRKFNIIFADAPYARGLSENLLTQILTKQWLKDKALCILEVRKDETFPLPEEFELIDERIYGLARILFLRLR